VFFLSDLVFIFLLYFFTINIFFNYIIKLTEFIVYGYVNDPSIKYFLLS
jgi:hypothetical protein